MATIKHKRAFKAVVNGSTLTEAMKIAKYAPSTIRRTNKLTRTKGWQELLNKELPDGYLAKRHRELLDKREVNLVRKKADTGEEIYEVLDQPETQAVSKGLDMAYKLKNRYPKEEPGGDTFNTIIFTDEQSLAIARRRLAGDRPGTEASD